MQRTAFVSSEPRRWHRMPGISYPTCQIMKGRRSSLLANLRAEGLTSQPDCAADNIPTWLSVTTLEEQANPLAMSAPAGPGPPGGKKDGTVAPRFVRRATSPNIDATRRASGVVVAIGATLANARVSLAQWKRRYPVSTKNTLSKRVSHQVQPKCTTLANVPLLPAFLSQPPPLRAREKFVPLPDANARPQVVAEEDPEQLEAELKDDDLAPLPAVQRGRITVVRTCREAPGP